MDNKNNVWVAVVLLVIGVVLGYCLGVGRVSGGDDANTRWGMGGGMHGAMRGMMMDLEGRTGDDLDRAFLDGMIVHHQGALSMAEALLRGTKRPELVQLGKDIIAAQTKEIELMRGWRQQWFAR